MSAEDICPSCGWHKRTYQHAAICKPAANRPIPRGINGHEGINGQPAENKRTRGRPRKWTNDAERKRAERD